MASEQFLFYKFHTSHCIICFTEVEFRQHQESRVASINSSSNRTLRISLGHGAEAGPERGDVA